MTYLLFLWKYKAIVGIVVVLAAIIATVAVLSRQASIAEREAKAAREETMRQRNKAEGFQILQNTNTIAGEIENEKKLANQKAINSNASNNAYGASVNRDSGAFSGNYDSAKRRYCDNFPNDSKCQ